MAKYYYKNSAIVAPFSIYSNEPHFDMTTISLRTVRYSQGHQRWEMNFRLQGEASTEVDLLLGAIENLDSTETMIMPQLPSVLARDTTSYPTLDDTIFISVAANAGDTFVFADVSFSDGLLPRGTFFKFDNHDKIYITTADTNLSSGADVALNFYPKLRVDVSNVNRIKTGDEALFTHYRAINNQPGITFTDGVLTDIGSITLVEAV